jgi:excisionase family DNA binding protein
MKDKEASSNGEPPAAVLTVAEAGKILRISKGLAYEMARSGTLPTIRLGRRLLVPRLGLDRLLDQRRDG